MRLVFVCMMAVVVNVYAYATEEKESLPLERARKLTGPKKNLNVTTILRDRIKDGNMIKLGSLLSELVAEQETYSKLNTTEKFKSQSLKNGAMENQKNSAIRIVNGKILIKIVGGEAKDLENELSSIAGLDITGCLAHVCSAYSPLQKLTEIAALNSVSFLQATQSRANIGSVTSEGDSAMYSYKVRSFFGVNGTGIKICVISDSYNCTGGASQNIATGDLPADGVQVVKELSPCTNGVDEGRAMLQIAYDIAPGAELAFRTGIEGSTDMANGINQLVTLGCNIIVDDLT